MIDDIDRQILTILQENARTSNAEIARRIGMVPSAIFERIRKMEDRGVIEGYDVRLKPSELGLSLLAFIMVRTEDVPYDTKTAYRLAEIPEVLEVHTIAGEDCYFVKIRASDTESLALLMKKRFSEIKSIISTSTTIVLDTVKEKQTLPLGGKTSRNSKDVDALSAERAD